MGQILMVKQVFSQEEEKIYLQFYSRVFHNVSVKELVFSWGLVSLMSAQ